MSSVMALLGCVLAAAPPAKASDVRRDAVVRCVEKVRSSVLSLTVQGSGEKAKPGWGAALVIDRRGFAVTNHHVIDGVAKIIARDFEGKSHAAVCLASDRDLDLALLLVDGLLPACNPPSLAGREPAILGEVFVAIGNPLGYEHSVTAGRIAASERATRLPSTGSVSELLQVSGTLASGNSGGPLFSIDGRLLGLIVAKAADGDGIGFAIPTRKIGEWITKRVGPPPAAFRRLGLEVAEANERERFLRVVKVDPKGPAARAGIVVEDEITAVDNVATAGLPDLIHQLWLRPANSRLKITLRSPKQPDPRTVELALKGVDPTYTRLGVWVEMLDGGRLPSSLKDDPRSAKIGGGLKLRYVAPDSPAAKAGMRPSDVLVDLFGYETRERDSLERILNLPDLMKAKKVECFTVRGGRLLPKLDLDLSPTAESRD